MKHQFKDIRLTLIDPNPHNFRQNFSGLRFEEFTASIEKQGVVQPILVRPKGERFEIVFGERRFRAAKIVAEKKNGRKTVPAIVRELNDADAYDMMVLENLQREDLTEYEEAQGFKLYLDKNGDEALAGLAERTGITPAYIRRRVLVFRLPGAVITAWRNGGIRFGYLEQLCRIDDETEIMALFEEITEGSYRIDSIKDLKRIIDMRSVQLKHARFDLEGQGCLACHFNSDVQMRLFEIDSKKARCDKPLCFKEKQKAWLSTHWIRSGYHRNHKTTGFRFIDDIDRRQVNLFGEERAPGDPCFACDAFVTVFSSLAMDVFFDRACIGEYGCFKKTCAKKAQAKDCGDTSEQNPEQGGDDEPRVAWHGEYFREQFFQEAIPQRFEGVDAGELQAVQLALYALVRSAWELRRWFMETYAGIEREEYYFIDETELFKPIAAMDINAANEALKAVTLKAAMPNEFCSTSRRLVAEHIGIDLAKEWMITEVYLAKKHIPEILGMGERLGIFADPKAKSYLEETLGKRDFGKCKKKELVELFCESGAELVGKVPEEILN